MDGWAWLGGIIILIAVWWSIYDWVQRSRRGVLRCQLALGLFAVSFAAFCIKLLLCILLGIDDTPLSQCLGAFFLIPVCVWMAGVFATFVYDSPKQFQAFWSAVGDVLGPGHEHGHRQPDSGPVAYTLRGTYNGYEVQARLTPFHTGQFYSPHSEVCLRSNEVGPAWRVYYSGSFWPRSDEWRIATESPELERRLSEAGVIEAAERALGSQKRHGPSLRYAQGQLCCFCSNPEPPNVEQFRQYLEVLVWLDAVNYQLNH